jgi:DNA replication protein DnaC
MTNLTNIFPSDPIPPFFRTAEEARWACQTCGMIEPHYSKHNGLWLKASCNCLILAARKREADAERHRLEIAILKSTFEWLGPEWSDRPLAMKTFENFKSDLQVEGYAAAEMFVQVMEGSLILHGVFGTGKTHLLASVCNRLRALGKESRFTTAPNLFGAIQERMNYNDDYNKIIRWASTTPLLVIDDIDKAKWSEFREEKYFAIIDNRVKRGLPTAISTNRLDELANFVGGAVASRLSIGQVEVEMNGQDYRKLL